MSKNIAIAETVHITRLGSTQLSAVCPFETSFAEFQLLNGETYKWYSCKSADLPESGKVLLFAYGTPEKTLKRVHVSFKNRHGMMKTVGMRRPDISLVKKLF